MRQYVDRNIRKDDRPVSPCRRVKHVQGYRAAKRVQQRHGPLITTFNSRNCWRSRSSNPVLLAHGALQSSMTAVVFHVTVFTSVCRSWMNRNVLTRSVCSTPSLGNEYTHSADCITTAAFISSHFTSQRDVLSSSAAHQTDTSTSR